MFKENTQRLIEAYNWTLANATLSGFEHRPSGDSMPMSLRPACKHGSSAPIGRLHATYSRLRSDQIAELRHHQPPDTGHAPTYERLMFAADLTMAESQEESGSKELCLQSARQAKQDLQQQPG
jgi:hypothetical protein